MCCVASQGSVNCLKADCSYFYMTCKFFLFSIVSPDTCKLLQLAVKSDKFFSKVIFVASDENKYLFKFY
jgi:hypothetical protein